jgi:hypothetical protein
MSQDIQIGYPQVVERKRTLIKDLEDLECAAQMEVSYNDGSDVEETSTFTVANERDYRMPPDRQIKILPVTQLGTKLLESTGEVTIHSTKIVNADGSYDHTNRISVRIAFTNWSAIQDFICYPCEYPYMVLVTDGTATHLYKVTTNTGPLLVQFPDDMGGVQTIASATKYVEFIFYDDTYDGMDGTFIDDSGTLYWIYQQPITVLVNVYNSVDTGLLGGIGVFTDLGLNVVVDAIVKRFSDNETVSLLANTLGVRVSSLLSSIGVAVAMASYYRWIEIEKFFSNNGLQRILNGLANPAVISSQLVALGAGALGTKFNGILSSIGSMAAGGLSGYFTMQALLTMMDDVQLNIYA